MLVYVLILVCMTILGAFAGMFLKKASTNKNIKEMLKDKNIYLGSSFYLFAAIFNVIVLRKLEFSFVLPFTALTYVWTMFISYFILKEKISAKKLIGVTFILGGAILVALG